MTDNELLHLIWITLVLNGTLEMSKGKSRLVRWISLITALFGAACVVFVIRAVWIRAFL